MIYFIKEEPGEYVKIGYTKQYPENRLRSFQIGNPRKLSIEATEPGDVNKEAYLHSMFHKHRVSGEWFKYTNDIKAYITREQMPAVDFGQMSREQLIMYLRELEGNLNQRTRTGQTADIIAIDSLRPGTVQTASKFT